MLRESHPGVVDDGLAASECLHAQPDTQAPDATCSYESLSWAYRSEQPHNTETNMRLRNMVTIAETAARILTLVQKKATKQEHSPSNESRLGS